MRRISMNCHPPLVRATLIFGVDWPFFVRKTTLDTMAAQSAPFGPSDQTVTNWTTGADGPVAFSFLFSLFLVFFAASPCETERGATKGPANDPFVCPNEMELCADSAGALDG
jgi:hypothetical protein